VTPSASASCIRPIVDATSEGFAAPLADSRADRTSSFWSADSVRRVSETDGVASKFMLIFRGGAVSRSDLSPTELQAHVAKWYAWSDELTRQGRRIVGTPLDNPGVTVHGLERMVTDGPYAESKDLVTGSMIIEAASLEDAVEVARSCPTYEFDGSVEVRPVQDHRL
jgi:hypothetical protein